MSYSAANLSVPECIGGLPSCFVPLGSPQALQSPLLDYLQCTALSGDFFIQRILCPVKVTSFQSSEPTWNYVRSLVRTRCSISFPLVPNRPPTKRLVIPATDFPVAGLPAVGCSVFFQMLHPFVIAHAIQKGRFQCRTAVRWSFVPSAPMLAHAADLNTARTNIDQLVSEPCHNCTVPCQECSTNVEEHRSCHMQVSLISRQYKGK